MLEVCEELVTDLEYVAYVVKPCFPPKLDVLDICAKATERILLERIDACMKSMDDCVKSEPQAVLIFNKFLQTVSDIEDKLDKKMPSISERLKERLKKYEADYMIYLQQLISQAFSNIALMKDGYNEQENLIVERVCNREKVTNYSTELLDRIASTMTNFVRTVEGQLFGERLHEVFIHLAQELTTFVTVLRQRS